MDNIFSDLGKFGITIDEEMSIYEEEKAKAAPGVKGEVAQPVEVKEEDFILERTLDCPLCDAVVRTKSIKSNKARRMEPDKDLRPRYYDIDANKYGVTVCTVCGYAALDKNFIKLPAPQEKLIREKISMNFTGHALRNDGPTYSYDMAIERYKLALLNCVVRKGKASERAFLCLKIAWIYRGKGESLDSNDKEYAAKKAECDKLEKDFMKNAYEGFSKAMASESFPMCGMDESTVDYIMACTAAEFNRYDLASNAISRILTGKNSNRRIKDKALDLKQEILEKLKAEKAEKK